MTDISDLREGDEIEVVVRARVNKKSYTGEWTASLKDGSFLYLNDLKVSSESVTVVRPEIIPGQPYVDADGKLYVGRTGGRVVRLDRDVHWYGTDASNPLPAGLRSAKVVPQ